MKFVQAAALAFALCIVNAGPALAERPVEAFLEPNGIGWAELSPDGKKLVLEMDVQGERRILVMPLHGEGESVVINKPDETEIFDVSWVNDEWLIAQLGRKGRYQGFPTYISRVVSFRADGKEMHLLEPDSRQMMPYGGGVAWMANDGTPRILLEYALDGSHSESAYFPQVAMVDVSTGKFSREVSPMQDITDWYADGTGMIRVGVGAEKRGARTRMVYRDPGDSLLKERASVEFGEELVAPVLFLADGKTALTISNRDGHDAVYELDLVSMSLGKKIFGVPGYDVSGIVKNASENRLLGVRWRDQRSRVKWFDQTMADAQALLEASLPGHAPMIVSSSDDLNRHVVYTSGNQGIAGYFLFDVGQKRLTPISRAEDDGGWAIPRTYRYTARDGLAMDAVVTLPRGLEAKNLPVLIMPHGGPRARDSEGWDTWAQFFADRGYAVIQPNFRGSTGYGVEFEKAGLGEWGLKMQDDVDDALAWAVKKGMVDPRRACIIGGSYGGYVAMRAAERNPDLYRCAISFAGVSDLGEMMRHDSKGYFGAGLRKYWKGQLSDVDGVSPINNVEAIGIPVLLVHGKKDQRVPVEQSREMAEKLTKAGKDVLYIEQKDNDHHFSRDEDMVEFLLAAEKFLDEHNPAG